MGLQPAFGRDRDSVMICLIHTWVKTGTHRLIECRMSVGPRRSAQMALGLGARPTRAPQKRGIERRITSCRQKSELLGPSSFYALHHGFWAYYSLSGA